MRHITSDPVQPCPFCQQVSADDIDHWFECTILRNVCQHVSDGPDSISLHTNTFHLHVPLTGRQLQLIPAVIHALWRCRCVCVRGLKFTSVEDLAHHVRSLVEDPWLHGSPTQMSRTERRASRFSVPRMPNGWCIYFGDGASRSRGEERQASLGVILWINGRIEARYGQYLGDQTNNVAEYSAAIAALKHILVVKAQRNMLRLDSLLITKQLNGEWVCNARHLRPLYEEGLALIRRIRRCRQITQFSIEHVYREFNADADATANETIDRYRSNTVVINEG